MVEVSELTNDGACGVNVKVPVPLFLKPINQPEVSVFASGKLNVAAPL